MQRVSLERASQLCLKCWIFGAVLILNALSHKHPALLGWAVKKLLTACDKCTQEQIWKQIHKYIFGAVLILTGLFFPQILNIISAAAFNRDALFNDDHSCLG